MVEILVGSLFRLFFCDSKMNSCCFDCACLLKKHKFKLEDNEGRINNPWIYIPMYLSLLGAFVWGSVKIYQETEDLNTSLGVIIPKSIIFDMCVVPCISSGISVLIENGILLVLQRYYNKKFGMDTLKEYINELEIAQDKPLDPQLTAKCFSYLCSLYETTSQKDQCDFIEKGKLEKYIDLFNDMNLGEQLRVARELQDNLAFLKSKIFKDFEEDLLKFLVAPRLSEVELKISLLQLKGKIERNPELFYEVMRVVWSSLKQENYNNKKISSTIREVISIEEKHLDKILNSFLENARDQNKLCNDVLIGFQGLSISNGINIHLVTKEKTIKLEIEKNKLLQYKFFSEELLSQSSTLEIPIEANELDSHILLFNFIQTKKVTFNEKLLLDSIKLASKYSVVDYISQHHDYLIKYKYLFNKEELLFTLFSYANFNGYLRDKNFAFLTSYLQTLFLEGKSKEIKQSLEIACSAYTVTRELGEEIKKYISEFSLKLESPLSKLFSKEMIEVWLEYPFVRMHYQIADNLRLREEDLQKKKKVNSPIFSWLLSFREGNARKEIRLEYLKTTKEEEFWNVWHLLSSEQFFYVFRDTQFYKGYCDFFQNRSVPKKTFATKEKWREEEIVQKLVDLVETSTEIRDKVSKNTFAGFWNFIKIEESRFPLFKQHLITGLCPLL